jgi:hypothetical protein
MAAALLAVGAGLWLGLADAGLQAATVMSRISPTIGRRIWAS